MATLVSNTFTSYQLTDEEKVNGSMLTITQQQIIQTHIASIAEEKLALEFNVNDHLAFIQREAGLTGQMAALRWLLDVSEAAEAEHKLQYQQPLQD
jgi:hypothetical protein